MSRKVLVTFSKDWADEFSAEGLAIMTDEQFDKLKIWAENANWYFGTNEGWDDEDISRGFSAAEITDEEEAVLIKLIPDLAVKYAWQTIGSFGQFPARFEEPND